MIVSILEKFISQHPDQRVTIGCLMQYLFINTPAPILPRILLTVFGCISMIPVPGPNAILCLPLMLISLWLIADKKTFSVPDFISRRGIDYLSLKSFFEKTRSRLVFCEKVFTPRMIWAVPKKNLRMIGLLVLALAFFISLPIPFPGANIIPAACVILAGCGVLFKDGLAILIAVIGGIIIMGTMSFLLYSFGKFVL